MDDPAYWRGVFKYYGMFKRGFLPQAGSVLDQSNKAVELFSELDQVGEECQEQLDEERSRPKGDPAGHRR